MWARLGKGEKAGMLLQSHTDKIVLLPTIPVRWAQADSFKGLRVRGGFTVDYSWQDGRVRISKSAQIDHPPRRCGPMANCGRSK